MGKQSAVTPLSFLIYEDLDDPPSLDDIRVASPCSADRSDMRGDERVRRCSVCKLSVYNLSALPGEDALQLVRETEDRTCVRFYRRFDGTILTQDCPDALAGLLVALIPISTALWNLVRDVVDSASHAGYGGGDILGEMVFPEELKSPEMGFPIVLAE